MAERVRMRGSLTLPDAAASADVEALIELEADREDGVPELARWVRVEGLTMRCQGSPRTSYAGWRALQRALNDIAAYARGGRIDLDHEHAGRVVIQPRARKTEWLDDFAKVLEQIKRSFGGARLDDRSLRIHLERSAGRVTVPYPDSTSLVIAWSRAFDPGEGVLFVRNRFSEVDPKLDPEGAAHHLANVLVCPDGGGGGMRTPFRLDRAPLSALDPRSQLLERSRATSPFACAYFLGRGVAYELQRDGATVIAADADDPLLIALR